MTTRHSILIVDDEAFVRESLAELLASEGLHVATADGLGAARGRLEAEAFDLVVTDLKMPEGDGVAVVRAAAELGHEGPVIVLTGVGNVPDAVEAMRAGAWDFVQKPVEPDAFVLLVQRALEHRELSSEVVRLRHALAAQRGASGGGAMVGASEWFRSLEETLERVAPSDATVLITGESGTGKELIANAIHERSARADGPLVRVNCAAVPETLFESEFFGHKKGSFTGANEDRTGRFAEARGGTLVLDEIGTLEPAMQAKLLRALESGEYQVVGESRSRIADVRVIAVTNEDIAARVQDGGFRADLYWRLAIFPIEVPPLRERREDVAVIAQDLLSRIRARTGGGARGAAEPLSEAALEVLTSYDWPGNVRELRNAVERALILSGGATPDADLFRSILESGLATGPRTAPSAPPPGAEAVAAADGGLHLRARIEAVERDTLLTALERAGGVKRDAAALLGIDPRNLGYYLRKHGLQQDGRAGRES